jgi:F0F1-type ATP synthase gamma subunit
MITGLTNIRESIETGEALRAMAEVYSELAVSRLGQIRTKIERNRQFAFQLGAVFRAVKTSTRQVQGRTVVLKPQVNVVLTSNQTFYGRLEGQLWQYFLDQQKKFPQADLIVVGQAGEQALRALHYRKPYQAVALSHDLPKPAELTELNTRLAAYDRVMVFFPEFQTVALQKMVATDISGGVDEAQALTAKDFAEGLYILEPEAAKMLGFFESQIMRLLLEQSLLEAELARTASRLLTMDEAQRRAQTFVLKERRLLAQAQKAKREVGVLEMSLGILSHKKLDLK